MSEQEKNRKTNDTNPDQDLDKESREKLNTALNYYLYSIGDIKCVDFDQLKVDDTIKDHVDNIEILSCLYDHNNPYNLIRNMLTNLNIPPSQIIKILKHDKKAGLKKNEQQIKTVTNDYQRNDEQLKSQLNDTNEEIKTAKHGLEELRKSIEALEIKRDTINKKMKTLNKNHEETVITIEQNNISLQEENNKGYKNLRNYEDVGHELNQLSMQLKILESNRKKPTGQKYTLNPRKTCVEEYKVDQNDKSKCICKTNNGGMEVCDPYHCKNLPHFKEHQKCKLK